MPKILIADDNTNIQKMVSLAFEERGIDVVSVGNGETAVRKLPDVNPDLVLADVFMPVRNGYEVCEFVKKDTRYAHVPVILLVGAFDPLDEREARRVGADGVLKKPFVPPDPLIAMVMSALERNPRVAAELAKAKEVIPEPEPLPEVLENPAQKAPAPLPDFPEPTEEEAAQIYGFGKGVRTLDEAEETAKDTSPKQPVKQQDDEEEDDGTSTHHDWKRRKTMDLDIPDDIASQPTFSMDQDFSPISFPSERDVPPRHIRPQEAAVESVKESIASAKPHIELPLEPAAPSKAAPPAPVQSAPVEAPIAKIPEPAAPSASAPAPVSVESERPHGGFRSTLSSILSLVKPSHAPAAPAAPVAVERAETAPPPPAAPPVRTRVFEPDPEPVPESVPHSLSAPEPVSAPPSEPEPAPAASSPTASASSSSHWMDLMSPSPSPAATGGSWLDSLSSAAHSPAAEAKSESAAPVEHASASHSDSSAAAPAVERESDLAAPDAASDYYSSSSVEEPGDTEAHAGELQEAVHDAVREEVREAVRENPPVFSGDEILAESPDSFERFETTTPSQQPRSFGADSGRSGFSYHFSGDEHAHPSSSAFEESAAASSAPAFEPEPAAAAPAAPAEASFFAPDPEPPQEAPSTPVVAAPSVVEHIPPAHEFAAETTVAETVQEFFSHPSEESSERIPTAPPPNREALAGIPFLVPPKEITEPVNTTPASSNGSAPVDVDAVVQKVIEKLGPQLQEMLAQGLLKPLVESMLQQELAKKDK